MNHIKPIIIKFIIYCILITMVLLFYGFSFLSLVTLSAILAVVTYVLGDMFTLPLKGNWVATLTDGATVFLGVLIWIVPTYGFYFSTIGGALFVAFLVAVCEWFLHIYVIGRLDREDREPIYD
ncbi:DUF2512 family protein [Anaerobacillus sp. CMMVII]|uniref:YndM family protein n=1 Tax=Anaerobacillus sp. CMMVII TaxID=2755588 RepID=UPI0021B732E6|nr:YndM family protein [Anaerobacillus sp. CMMVII]MCT8138750.1 DUF2512 family protein [Anaerobacillus sp. CMMVII]